MVAIKEGFNVGCSAYFIGAVGPIPNNVQLNDELQEINQSPVKILSLPNLPSSDDSMSLGTPSVVVMNYEGPRSQELIDRVRFHWHGADTVMCFTKTQACHIPALLAKGLHDFIEIPAESQLVARRLAQRIAAYNIRSKESTRQVGPLTVNLMQRTVSNGRETSFLTPIETRIVTTLADQMGAVVERNSMKQLCWGDSTITDNALNRKIYEVRRTLRKLSDTINIRTIYGLGFELYLGADQGSMRPESN